MMLVWAVKENIMSETINQECSKCGTETDCIESLCQECVLDIQDEMRLMTEKEEKNV